jgi:hypothetical protein
LSSPKGSQHYSSARHISAPDDSSRVVRLDFEDVGTIVEPYGLALPPRRCSSCTRSRPRGFPNRSTDPDAFAPSSRLPCPWAPLQSMNAAASPIVSVAPPTDPGRSDARHDSMQHTRQTATRRTLPAVCALWPSRARQSGRSLPGLEQPSTHEPRRRTSLRRTHQSPSEHLDRGPLALADSPEARPIAQGDRETPTGDAPLAAIRSPTSLDHASLACHAGLSTEADVSGRRAEARQADPPHTPNTGCRCLSAAETVSRQDNHLAPPRGRARLSMLSLAEARGNKRQCQPPRHE